MRLIALSIFSLLLSSLSFPEVSFAAEQRYVRDLVSVPVRTGQSNAYRIVHHGITSGTKVTVLEDNPETNYSRIRLVSGVEGWIESQYLQKQETAAMRLKEAEATIKRLTDSEGSVGAELLTLEKEHKALNIELEQNQQKLQEASQELERIKTVSANAINLDSENKKLLKELENLKHQRDTLSADNNRLNDELKRNEFINGAIAVLLGIIATLIIQYFYSTRSRKRSEWA